MAPDPLDALLEAAAQTSDPAIRNWLAELHHMGDRAEETGAEKKTNEPAQGNRAAARALENVGF